MGFRGASSRILNKTAEFKIFAGIDGCRLHACSLQRDRGSIRAANYVLIMFTLRLSARRSVSRVLSRPSRGGDGHSSGTFVAERLARPTRAAARKARPAALAETGAACRSYLVLLPVGFALPPPLPAARCALTAPFHPCRPPPRKAGGLGGVFLWHFPWGRPRRALPGTVPPWSPDFPPSAERTRRRAAIRPSGWDDLGCAPRCQTRRCTIGTADRSYCAEENGAF